MTNDDLQKLATKVVSAYLSNNPVSTAELPNVIQQVFQSLATVDTLPSEEAAPTPAVAIKKSVRPEAITCLECGKAMKMLKRHLHTEHDLSVEEYRAKWKLGADYPVVAPDYAEARSSLAIKAGLGRKKVEAKPEKKKSTRKPTPQKMLDLSSPDQPLVANDRSPKRKIDVD